MAEDDDMEESLNCYTSRVDPTDASGQTTLGVQTIVRACGSGLFPFTQIPGGKRGYWYAFEVTGPLGGEILRVRIEDGARDSGNRYELSVVEITTPHDAETFCESFCN